MFENVEPPSRLYETVQSVLLDAAELADERTFNVTVPPAAWNGVKPTKMES